MVGINLPNSVENSCCHKQKKQDITPGMMDKLFTCPMHPEIEQIGPGDCPLCGMALEPSIVSLEETVNHELIDFTRRFWVGLIFTIPLLILEMGGHFGLFSSFISHTYNPWLQLCLASPVVLWCGLPFFVRGWKSILNRSLNMFTLVSIGTGIAFIYSFFITLMPQTIPVAFISESGALPLYYESAAVIIVLVLLGQILELRARDRTSDALKSLLNLAPKTASLISGETETTISLAEVKIYDNLRIRPGEKIPVDGLVIEGESYIDVSMLTGEPMPILKKQGSMVQAGTVNTNGALIIKAMHVGGETMLSQIVNLVAKAQRTRAPIQNLADQVAAYFVPIVILIAIASLVFWTLFAPNMGLSFGIMTMVSVLIIACPCALGLATPMSIMVGIGRSAKYGILVKNAKGLESLNKVDTLVLDKTGTLTEGKPILLHVEVINGTEQKILTMAASLEQNSEHPLARAILQTATDKNIALKKIINFQAITGQGISGMFGKKQLLFGNGILLREQNVIFNDNHMQSVEAWQNKGATVMFLAKEGELQGFIVVSDPIKTTTKKALFDLKRQNLNLIMLTGDNQKTAKAVAKDLDIDEVYADVMPADKYNIITELQKEGKKVAMVGDGVNDAPALAAADVGIAMASGTDIAIESADLTLLAGDLSHLVTARKLSHMVIKNIRQNLVLAFGYNALGVPIAAGILYPFTQTLLSPMIAALAMSLSSVSVIINALRLAKSKL